jgi:DNA-binding MarR family transcriptional regulator
VHDISGYLTEFRQRGSLKKSPPKSKNPQLLNIDDFLCFAVYTAHHAFNRVYQPLLQELGLTYPQFIAMLSLWSRDPLTVSELGERLYLRSNTLTPMLKRLEERGYIARSRDDSDERQVNISLTAAGKKLEAKASGIIKEVRRATGLTDREMKRVLASVSELRDALGTLSS